MIIIISSNIINNDNNMHANNPMYTPFQQPALTAVKLPSHVKSEHIYFTETARNVGNSGNSGNSGNNNGNSVFSRIMSCEPEVNIIGLHIGLQLVNATVQNVVDRGFCKLVARYDPSDCANREIIGAVQQIEQMILRLYQSTFKAVNKGACFHIYDTMMSGNLKISNGSGAGGGGAGGGGAGGGAGGGGGGTQLDVDDDHDDDHDVDMSEVSQRDKDDGCAPYIVLKISGVWETETTYGITFKYVTARDSW